ncbi:hypothetical protein EVA_17790 [gut metagenome]|uniref:Uncharacterized protein n=1 Tax=gut metagenome TaxID=749906 RepID=J9G3K5_9ZZZZ
MTKKKTLHLVMHWRVMSYCMKENATSWDYINLPLTAWYKEYKSKRLNCSLFYITRRPES